MKIGVVGAGAVGGYFGGRLAQAGHDVCFLARGRNLATLRERGLRVHSVHGHFSLGARAELATDQPDRIGACDVVLFTVKSFDTEVAATLLPPLLGPETAVISLQNGIDNEEKLAARIGPEHVVGGVALVLLDLVEPAVVRHTGGATRIVVGEMDGRRTGRLEALVDACQTAGFGAEIAEDIRPALWMKFGFICAQAGMTAATRLPIGPIRDTPPTWALFLAVVREAVAVARAEGVKLPEDAVERQAAMAEGLEPDAYASLHNDLVAGRRMELEALLGELVRRGRHHGLPTPVSEVLYGLLKPWAERHASTAGGARGARS